MPLMSATPVGTLDELRELNRDGADWCSCSQKVKGENQGCSRWLECRMPYKGQSGPHNEAVFIAKPTGNGAVVRITVMPCFSYLRIKPQIVANGGVCRLVNGKKEGDTVLVRGSVRVVPEDKRLPIRYETRDDIPFVIPPFPRPNQQPDLASAAYLQKLRAEEREDSEPERERKLLGLDKNGHDAPDVIDLDPPHGETVSDQEPSADPEPADRAGARGRQAGGRRQ